MNTRNHKQPQQFKPKPAKASSKASVDEAEGRDNA